MYKIKMHHKSCTEPYENRLHILELMVSTFDKKTCLPKNISITSCQ